MNPRAGVLVTGTEVLNGIILDRNGPWISENLRGLGIDLAYILVVGDRSADMLAALDFMRCEKLDLIVTTGGLGPTEDDRTIETVADYFGIPLIYNSEMAGRIAEIVRPFNRRYPGLASDAIERANAKQAKLPEGATVLDPIGTAPGVVLGSDMTAGPVVFVLPGPPAELQPMWRNGLVTQPLRALLERSKRFEFGILRLFGMPESELAATLRSIEDGGLDLSALEITTCLRRGEIEIATRYLPEQKQLYDSFVAEIKSRHSRQLFAKDGERIEEQIARLLSEQSLNIAVGESCTGGLLGARLTDLPGASEYFSGGVVAYSNEAKVNLLGVDYGVLDRYGAVSEPVAEQLAEGAKRNFRADIGVGITGVAGPGGGSAKKPVGRCYISVVAPFSERKTVMLDLPGDRATVRDRAVTVALHLVRRALCGGFAQ